MKLLLVNGEYETVSADIKLASLSKEKDEVNKDQLVEVFRDGVLLKDWKFSEIRERAAR